MAIYALWNNKGGVGKSYLTFQVACEYARIHSSKQVLVIDMCPQANASSMLLGGIEKGEAALESLSSGEPRRLSLATYATESQARIIAPPQAPNM